MIFKRRNIRLVVSRAIRALIVPTIFATAACATAPTAKEGDASTSPQQLADGLNQAGQDASKRGELLNAIKYFRNALEFRSGHGAARRNLGLALSQYALAVRHKHRDQARTLELLAEAVRYRPNDRAIRNTFERHKSDQPVLANKMGPCQSCDVQLIDSFTTPADESKEFRTNSLRSSRTYQQCTAGVVDMCRNSCGDRLNTAIKSCADHFSTNSGVRSCLAAALDHAAANCR